MREQFIVDWQISETASGSANDSASDFANDSAGESAHAAASFVSLRMQGRRVGLYRVQAFMPKGILLTHGAISFPVGTRLDVEDVLGIVPGLMMNRAMNRTLNRARVVANDPSGVRLAW